MGSQTVQDSLNKDSTKEVYDKLSNILRAIEQCGCEHCLTILKSGLRKSPEPTVDDNHQRSNQFL